MLAADDGARIVAGGQTLVPLMAMRLARPTRLIDIARIPGLAYVRDEGAVIAIGATTKQHVVENDPLIRAKLPLLAKALPYVGHDATRARGTIGGSLANGDHAAEIVLVAATLGATIPGSRAPVCHRSEARRSRCRGARALLSPHPVRQPPGLWRRLDRPRSAPRPRLRQNRSAAR